MIPSWLRLLSHNRFKGAARRPRRWPTQLEVEVLEARTMPTVVTWTGNLVPPPNISFNDPEWSSPGNWVNSVKPNSSQADDVIFPDTSIAPVNNKNFGTSDSTEVPSVDASGHIGFEPYNSWQNIPNLTLNTLTIESNDFVIGGQPITLKNELQTSTKFGSGVSLIAGNAQPLPGVVLTTGADILVKPSMDILLSGNPQSINIKGAGATLVIASALKEASGVSTAGLIKQGPGRLVLGNDLIDLVDFNADPNEGNDALQFETGNNTFHGLVEVAAGTLEINSAFSLGTPDQGTLVRDGATLRVSATNVANEALELIGMGNGGVGALQGGPGRYLNGGAEEVPLSLVEDFQGALSPLPASTWGGHITLSPSAAIGVIDGAHGQTTPPVLVTLTLTGGISGAGDLTKVGGGVLILKAEDTYNGVTDIRQGTISVLHNQALSEGSHTTVENGATLDFQGDNRVVDEDIIVNGDGVLDFTGNAVGALTSTGPTTNAELTGSVTLNTASSIGGDLGSVLIISGPLTGTGDLKKIGLSTLIFPNSNLGFTGNTFVNNGTLIIKDPLALGPVVKGGTITAQDRGSLELQGTFTIGKTLTLKDLGFNSSGALRLVGGSNTIVTWAGPITVGSSTSIFTDPNSQLTVTGVISGGSGATLEKDGNGTLVLAASNLYTGPTTLREGTTIIKNNRALGGADGFGTTVAAGATLQMGGGLNIPNDEILTLTGSGVNNAGALHVTDGNNTWAGIVNLSKTDPALVNTDGTSQITFSNVVSGSAPLEKAGTGTLILTGTTANSANGGALVDAGTLLLNKSAGIQALGGTKVVVGDGLGGQDADVLRLLARDQIADATNITVNKSGLFDLGGKNETIHALTLTAGHVTTGSGGTLTLGDDVTTNNTSGLSSVISGNLSLGGATRIFNVAQDPAGIDDLVVNATISSGINASAGLIKDGPGTMRLNAVNTYTGPTTVSAGTLKLGITNALVTNSILTLNGTFDLNNFNQTVAELSGAGTLKLGTGTFT
ncbi:MAG: autotransporter-associated beta strand repeat-containing protein, partial [Planctomycetes bacterium]|nr:autotransporter-associated beta strand repeat-containing protein [Planctomycetota bacterium]